MFTDLYLYNLLCIAEFAVELPACEAPASSGKAVRSGRSLSSPHHINHPGLTLPYPSQQSHLTTHSTPNPTTLTTHSHALPQPFASKLAYTPHSTMTLHLISRNLDPVFALFIGLGAAATRINREEKELGRSTKDTVDSLCR